MEDVTSFPTCDDVLVHRLENRKPSNPATVTSDATPFSGIVIRSWFHFLYNTLYSQRSPIPHLKTAGPSLKSNACSASPVGRHPMPVESVNMTERNMCWLGQCGSNVWSNSYHSNTFIHRIRMSWRSLSLAERGPPTQLGTDLYDVDYPKLRVTIYD